MDNKTLISIAIPTYNRSDFLKNLLECVVPQAEELGGLFKICVSNNCSTDDTREVVMDFQKKYSGLITYNENKENIGPDRNILKAIEMAEGEFIWLCGDDDTIALGAVKKVVNFVKNYCNENTGLVILGRRKSKTGELQSQKINIKYLMGTTSENSFMSALMFNNDFVKRIMEEEKKAVEKATGNYYIQSFLYQLMFLKYPKLEAIKFNEEIIIEGAHYRKPYVEDEFAVYYAGRKKLNDLLLNNKYMTDYYIKIIASEQKKIKNIVIGQMAVMKALGGFNYFSFSGCVKLFFQETDLADALTISAFFVIFYITPAFVLKAVYKFFIRIKYKKNWREIWLNNLNIFKKSKEGRRII